jgi:HTH-type transcriptional repressor of NAD biosynthesis genes
MIARTPHGLVIGKFYPPHDGHHLLVRTAAAASDRVTVLVLAHAVESIPLADRVAWMRDVHAAEPNVTVHGVVDDHPVDFEDPAVWDLHMAEFTRGVAEVTADPVTAVFTSEPYGPELARRLDAIDVPVDPGRGLAPISGTEIRADPVRCWDRLSEPARGWFARRVVVIGAESTGTTTVSLALRDALRARAGSHGLTRWVPEHGRDYTIDKLAIDRARAVVGGERPPAMDELVWTSDEFAVIAARQNALEDVAARIGGPVLVCDTDAFATGIWHERYLGAPDAATDALGRHHPLYLLTHHDGVPFEQDGIRDGESIREWMTERFVDALAATGRRTVVLRGPLAQRVADGLAAIDELLAEGWHLADPVTPANSSPSL